MRVMKNTAALTLLLASSLCALTACGHHQTGPMLLEDKLQPPGVTWTAVALTLSGPGVDHNKRDNCLEEAQKAGIQLTPASPVKGTLFFRDSDDCLQAEGLPGGRYGFAAMGSSAECRLALAKITNLDGLVPTSKTEPTGCKNLGSVEGGDIGWMLPGNYDAAVAEAQFKTRALGGNYLLMDVVRQVGVSVFIDGHALACPK